jgi:hypothetical protein
VTSGEAEKVAGTAIPIFGAGMLQADEMMQID